jgi:hypothetical protein
MAGQDRTEEDNLTKWQKMKGLLKEITDSLTGVKEAEIREKIRGKVALAEREADALYGQATKRGQNIMVKMVKDMDRKLEALVNNAGAQKARSWADVAAANSARMLPLTAQRATVRVRLADAAGKAPTELLTAVKPAIPGAYAVRQMRSGDIEVSVLNQSAKDRALNQAEVEGCKVLRQDYPVEVPGVPLATPIKHGKAIENDEVAKEVSAASKRLIPGITINRIRWLHDAKGHEIRLMAKKTRGTVIVSFPTQAMQHEAIRKGLVIGAEPFEASLYNNSLEMKQCFKCFGWGHTQAACGREERCGECAGNHPTKECSKERVSCVNCGKGHRAWQRRVCSTFQTFLDATKQKRIDLAIQTAAVRSASVAQSPTVPARPAVEMIAKRQRPQTQEEQTQTAKKGRGRPTNIEVASRDRSQSRIQLSTAQTIDSSAPFTIPSSFPNSYIATLPSSLQSNQSAFQTRPAPGRSDYITDFDMSGPSPADVSDEEL